MNKLKVWELEYSHHFKVPPYKKFINYKGKNSFTVEKSEKYHLNQKSKWKPNKTQWNCVPLYRRKYHFWDIPVKGAYIF